MRKTRSIAIFICFILTITVIAAGLSGCTTPVESFSVVLKTSVFAPDEAFDPQGSKLYVKFQTGATGYVNMTKAMVTEFDTSTSGEKVMKVTYRGTEGTVPFTVSGNVKTKARVTLSSGAGAECVIGLNNLEFEVHAISFMLFAEIEELPSGLTPLVKGWKAEVKAASGALSVLLYRDTGVAIIDNATLFNFVCARDATFTMEEVLIASDKAEFSLPNGSTKKS